MMDYPSAEILDQWFDMALPVIPLESLAEIADRNARLEVLDWMIEQVRQTDK